MILKPTLTRELRSHAWKVLKMGTSLEENGLFQKNTRELRSPALLVPGSSLGEFVSKDVQKTQRMHRETQRTHREVQRNTEKAQRKHSESTEKAQRKHRESTEKAQRSTEKHTDNYRENTEKHTEKTQRKHR